MAWTEETFTRLRGATPEPLVSRMRVNHAMILNVIHQRADPVATMRSLMEDNHEDEPGRGRLAERAQSLSEELLASGVLEQLSEPDQYARTLRLAPAPQADFALDQPFASFAQAAFNLIDPDSETHTLESSRRQSILDDPSPVLMAQAFKERGEAIAEIKAEGIEYDERMELLEQVTHPRPLAEPLEQALRLYRETHPWVLDTDLSPKSVVRDMYESAAFSEFVSFYGVARSEGLVLRYLSDAYRALRQTVPERNRPMRSTTSSSGSGRPSARSIRACSTSGRPSTVRIGGPCGGRGRRPASRQPRPGGSAPTSAPSG